MDPIKKPHRGPQLGRKNGIDLCDAAETKSQGTNQRETSKVAEEATVPEDVS